VMKEGEKEILETGWYITIYFKLKCEKSRLRSDCESCEVICEVSGSTIILNLLTNRYATCCCINSLLPHAG
jgi:hypothetical protein